MKAVLLGLVWLATVALCGAESLTALKTYERAVIAWVPPYETAKSKAKLRDQPTEQDRAASLSHVALQFWMPSKEGGVRRVTYYDKLTDDLIAEWRDWAHAHGLRALLCVYNGEQNWDWPLAHNAFAKSTDKFVSALVAEVELHGLDGIDVDLEGNGKFDQDKPAYLAFIQKLSSELHQRQKQLFVDSFSYVWNAPNQTWWPELFPLVNGINSMGYEQTGAQSPGWRGYESQAAAAGAHVKKLQIGLPTHLDTWQELPLQTQLSWFENAPCGVGLWDTQFKSSAWNQPEPWQQLKRVIGAKP